MAGLIDDTRTEMNPLRKKHKIQVEKRRRTRINNSLTELKTLLLQAMKKENSPEFAKLEKADILDMTVRYLRTIQHQQVSVAMASDPTAINKYTAGFSQCANEVMHYINKTDGEHSELKSRVGDHLTRCISQTTESNQQQLPSAVTQPMQVQRSGNPLRVEIPPQVRDLKMAQQTSGTLLMAVPEPVSKNVTCVQDSNLESHEGLLTPVTSPVSLKVNSYNEYQGLVSHYPSQYSPETTVHRLTSGNDLSSYSVSPVYRKYPSDLKQFRYSPYGVPNRASPPSSEGSNVWRPW